MSILSKSVSIVITISVCLAAAHAADVSSQMSNPKDRAALKAELIKEKKVKTWPRKDIGSPMGAIPLSVTECETLGGKLVVDAKCSFQITCQGANNRRTCITEMTEKP